MTVHTIERRMLEIFLACLTTGFGLWLLFPSTAMRSPALVQGDGSGNNIWEPGVFGWVVA